MKNDYYMGDRHDMIFAIPKKYSKILEIGCGEGGFRKHFSRNVEYWGIESNNNAIIKAQRHLTKVLRGTFLEVINSIPSAYFDTVICNDVIEHMENELDFLEKIKQKMNPESACLIGSVPNVRYIVNLKNLLIKKDWKYTESGILDKTHMRFFTKKSLARTLEQSGFHIDFIQGINSFKSNNISRIIASKLASFCLGSDTQYFQLAFKVYLEPPP